MKNNKSIKLNAAILLTVFALNTVVAFACSLGLNMGFNTKHQHHENEEEVSQKNLYYHSNSTAHHHVPHASPASYHEKSSKDKDGCCNDKAIQFQQVDKNLSHATTPTFKAPVFIAFMSAFYSLEIKTGKLISVTKFLIPQFYPPPDIRIAIQSFQI